VYRAAGQLSRTRPEAGDLPLANIVAGEEVLAGDVPDNVVGEKVHEGSRIAALLRIGEPADKLRVRVRPGAHHCTNIGMCV
jgi:hypothetical protein